MMHETNTATRNALLAAGLILGLALPSNAQQTLGLHNTPMLSDATLLTLSSSTLSSAEASTDALPEAPSAIVAPPVATAFAMDAKGIAPKYQVVIGPNQAGQKLTGKDKIVLSLRDTYSPENFLAIVFSAGYEQLTNGSPNYGTDKGAFGQRLGAAGIRETSQGILSEGVFAAAFHEDPRYYQLGRGVNFFHRTIYAITRPLITRTDSGNSTFNAALFAGYAATTAMSYAYYPAINQNAKDMASAFGGSIGGAALGFFVNEFSDQFLEAIHLKKKSY